MRFSIKSCRWCQYNLQKGSKIIAIISLIGTIVSLTVGIIFLGGYGSDLVHSGMLVLFLTLAYVLAYVVSIIGTHAAIWIWILIHLGWTVTDVLIIYGISTKRHAFLLPWLVAHMLTLIVSNYCSQVNF